MAAVALVGAERFELDEVLLLDVARSQTPLTWSNATATALPAT